MKPPKVYKGTVAAYLTDLYTTVDDLASLDCPVSAMAYTNSDLSGLSHWLRVGTAEVVVTMMDQEKLTLDAIEKIDAQIRETQAAAEITITDLKRRRQKLLAITLETGVSQ